VQTKHAKMFVFDMSSQVSFLREASPTELTGKWFLSRMFPDVHGQTSLAWKWFTTPRTQPHFPSTFQKYWFGVGSDDLK
jgi:hypothetical protein